MARTAELDSRDLLPGRDEMEGVLDYEHLVNGIGRIETITEREFKDMAEYERFMDDRLVIVCHGTTDKNAPAVVPVGVNGPMLWLPRDRKVRIPRRYVERLLQSQELSVSQERNPNPGSDEGMITRRSTGTPYPISILHDPNPKGRQWAARVMREGC